MNTLKVHGKEEYVTHSSPKLRNEKLHKLLFIASSYTSSHCPTTLAFQELCFLQVISNLIAEEITGCCGYNRSMLTRKQESQLILWHTQPGLWQCLCLPIHTAQGSHTSSESDPNAEIFQTSSSEKSTTHFFVVHWDKTIKLP